MTNKSGDIGTRTETAIVRYARANGFAGADEMTRAQRLRLNGARDQGDIGLCPGVMVGSKGGHAAEQASDALIATWLGDVEAQRRVRGAAVAFLVTKRKGKGYGNAGAWWAHMPGNVFVDLALLNEARNGTFQTDLPAVRLLFADALILLRRAGFGDPIGKDTAA